MNTPNPSSAEKDLESLRNAQRAHESSMDEILASIRSIIAEDREPNAANSRAPKPPAPGGPQIVYSNDFAPQARVAAFASETPTQPSESPAEIVSLLPRIAREFHPPTTEPTTPPGRRVRQRSPRSEKEKRRSLPGLVACRQRAKQWPDCVDGCSSNLFHRIADHRQESG